MKEKINVGNAVKLGAAVALLLVAGLGRHAGATIVTLAPAADTQIESSLSSQNYGNQGSADAGNFGMGWDGVSRGLFRFDLSSIPVGVGIQSATLRLAAINWNAATDATLSLYRMTTAWTEGTGGNPASAGATWWKPDASQSATWNAPGAGADYLSTASSSLTGQFLGSGTVRLEYSFTGLGADVQYWYSNPGLNDGWILRNSDEVTRRDTGFVDKAFYTKEYATFFGAMTEDATPYLDIEYFPIPEPGTISLLALGLGLCRWRRK